MSEVLNIVESASSRVENTVKRIGAKVLIFGLGVGVGYGIVVESRTNEVARGKAITAEACLEAIPMESTITEAFMDCMENGVPGGQKAEPESLEEGQPVSFINTYIQAQEAEAESIEPGRIVGWAASPFIVAGALTAWALS